jgi:gamma-glutamyltranspeptidase/glutathione hydrolase
VSIRPTFAKAAVAAPHKAAAETGRAILAEGGHAIEAMVAMAATIAVVYPHMNGIGGDSFWLIRDPSGRVRYIEACGPAGSRATSAFYWERGFETIPARGAGAALTVPGTIGGWELALTFAKGGGARVPLKDLLSEAIAYARDGYAQSPSEARTQPFLFDALAAAPGFAETFLVDGKIPAAGTIRRAPRLAETLDQLAHAGLDDFYRGDVGREIAHDLSLIGAPITRSDLANFAAVWRDPLSLRLASGDYFNAPPPTQGLASLFLLGLFDQLDVREAEGFDHIHGLIEAAKRAIALRDRVCTDHAHLKHVPADFLTPRALAREGAAIDRKRAAHLPIRPLEGDTIWMGAIDDKGWVVSFIQSIYWEYGSGCVLPRTGVLLQNRGASFSLDAGAVNPLSPGRRPVHTLNPPLAVLRDGRIISYGSMGGDGQPQFQAQVLTRLLFGASVEAALDRPRFLFGKTWGTAGAGLQFEPRFDSGLVAALRAAGHEPMIAAEAYSDGFGHAGALVLTPDGRIEAGHDPRSDGGAAGL